MSTIMKRPSTSPLDSMRMEMDRLFDDLIPFSWRRDEGEIGVQTWTPRTDFVENENEFQIHLDLPGMSKSDIKVNFQDGRLTISGERKREARDERDDFIRRERYHGTFYRTFTLPEAVKEDKIKANFKDGVLHVVVPKSEVSKPKEVKVE
jgi:HSP20 family protein